MVQYSMTLITKFTIQSIWSRMAFEPTDSPFWPHVRDNKHDQVFSRPGQVLSIWPNPTKSQIWQPSKKEKPEMRKKRNHTSEIFRNDAHLWHSNQINYVDRQRGVGTCVRWQLSGSHSSHFGFVSPVVWVGMEEVRLWGVLIDNQIIVI